MKTINSKDGLANLLNANNGKCSDTKIEITYTEFILALNNVPSIEFSDCIFSFVDSNNNFNTIDVRDICFQSCEFNTDFNLENLGVTGPLFEVRFEKCKFKGKLNFSRIVQVPDDDEEHKDYVNEVRFVFKDNSYYNFNPEEKPLEYSVGISTLESCVDANSRFYVEIKGVEKIQKLYLSNTPNLTIVPQIPIELLTISRIKSLNIQTGKGLELDEFRVHDCVLNSLPGATKIKRYEFWDSIVNPKLWIGGNFQIEYFDARRTTFEKTLMFQEYPVGTENNSEYHKIKSVSFENCNFPKKIEFIGSEIKKIKFDNCTFNESVKLINLKEGLEAVNFNRSTIKKFLLFNGWEDIISISEGCVIDFSYVFVEQTGHIIIRNINKNNVGEVDFKYANILGSVTFQDSKLNSLNLEKTTIVGQFNIEDVDVKKYCNRETVRRIKNEFKKNNDTVNALKYRAIEMNLYRQELIKDFKISQLPELLLLGLNTISNNNGRSWVRGIIFTLLAWFIFFGIFVCMRDGWGDTFLLCIPEYKKELVEYFWLPNGFDGLFSDTNALSSWGGIIVFFLGKIAIAYGIYQTIAAFRKYGK